MHIFSEEENKSLIQFNRWAKHYDKNIWTPYFKSCYKKTLEHIRLSHAYNILDVGCGTGELAIQLAQLNNNNKIFGLDISKEMIKIANSKKEYSSIANNRLLFIESTVEVLDFENSMFDYVFCLNNFHHFPNQQKFLNEVFRILKKDGALIILDPFTDNPLRKIWVVILKTIFREPYAKYHTKKMIYNLITGANLEPNSQQTFWYFCLFSVAHKV